MESDSGGQSVATSTFLNLMEKASMEEGEGWR